MAQSTNEQWLDVMYLVQRFVRARLDAGALEELPKYLSEHQLATSGELYRFAQPEIRRAVELLVPGLMVDFLMNNPRLLPPEQLKICSGCQDRQT
jgi:hypothetical protein